MNGKLTIAVAGLIALAALAALATPSTASRQKTSLRCLGSGGRAERRTRLPSDGHRHRQSCSRAHAGDSGSMAVRAALYSVQVK